jgi:hypothetical protein
VVIHGLTRNSRQSTNGWCLLTQGWMLWCNGIFSSLSLLPTCKMMSSKMMKAGRRLANELHHASHRHSSYSMLGCLQHYSWPIALFIHFLWVSAFVVDLFYGTCLLSLCSTAKVVVRFVFTGSYQTTNRQSLFSFILQIVSGHISKGLQQFQNMGFCPQFIWISSMLMKGWFFRTTLA